MFTPKQDMAEAAATTIKFEAQKRDLQNFAHLVCDGILSRALYAWYNHYLYPDYLGTKEVSPDVINDLAAYVPRVANGTHLRAGELIKHREGVPLWPRSNTRLSYCVLEPTELRVERSGHPPMHIWAFRLPARRQEGDMRYVVLSYQPSDTESVNEFISKLNYLSREMNAASKSISVFGGSDIKLYGKHTWDDLVLPPEILSAVKDDLEFWIAAEVLYKKRRLPYKRGYLFSGPPGNGKTAVARTIISSYDFAAQAFNFSNPKQGDAELQNAFQNAADSAPAVFLLEDVDRVFESESYRTRVTKEGLFNCLDGVMTNHGVVTIMTANHPELLDSAIRHRPGRVDVAIEFSNPGFEQRMRYLTKMLESAVPMKTLERVAEHCANKSMAFLKLIYEKAASLAAKDLQRSHNMGHAAWQQVIATDLQITAEHVLDGLHQALRYYESVETARDRKAGFCSDRGAEQKKELHGPSGENLSAPDNCSALKTSEGIDVGGREDPSDAEDLGVIE